MTPKNQQRVVLGDQLVAEGVWRATKNHFLHLVLAAGCHPLLVQEFHLLLSVFEMLASLENLREGKKTKEWKEGALKMYYVRFGSFYSGLSLSNS